MAIQRVDFGLSPRLIWIEETTDDISVQTLVNEIRDFEDDPIHTTYDKLLDAAGKESLGGGVFVGITATLNNARIAFIPTLTPLEEGTVTTADALGVTLTDSTALFITNNIKAGDQILNHTDGSVAMVLSVDSETQITCTPLEGGVDNQWDISDSYDVHEIKQKSISGGNLVAIDDIGGELNPVFATPYNQVTRTSSSSATLQELSAIQFSSFSNSVTVDIGNITGKAVSGTAFPTGTRQQPVDNMTDALAIANAEGLNAFNILGNVTLNDNTLDFTGFKFYGDNPTQTTITIDTLAIVNGCSFFNATVTGVLDGDSIIKDCDVSNITYFNGKIGRSAITGTITLGGGAEADIYDCRSGVPGSGTPIIDMGGSGQALGLRNYNGGITLRNKTGAEEVTIELDPGKCILENTVTAGFISVRGGGTLTDNSTGTTTVDSSALGDPSTYLTFTDLLAAKKVNI